MATLAQIKAALKVDYTDDDAELLRLRDAAVSLIERRTQLALSPRTETMYLARFFDTVLAAYPFNSLTSVAYTNEASATVTMPTADYWIDRSQGPMPVLRFLESPGIKEGTNIVVTYEAGYGQFPNEIIHAIISLVGHWYNNPEAAQPIGISAVPLSLNFILDHLSTRSNIR